VMKTPIESAFLKQTSCSRALQNNCSESDPLLGTIVLNQIHCSEQLFRIRSIVRNNCSESGSLFRNCSGTIVPIGTVVPEQLFRSEQLFRNNCSNSEQLFRQRTKHLVNICSCSEKTTICSEQLFCFCSFPTAQQLA